MVENVICGCPLEIEDETPVIELAAQFQPLCDLCLLDGTI